MLLCSGPQFSTTNEESEQPYSLIDIAPTVLYALGAKIPSAMEGKALLGLFNPDVVENRPVEFCDDNSAVEVGAAGYDAAEEELIGERLRNLGYIE